MIELQPCNARIVSITPETPTIVRILLEADGFSFIPGQWIDFAVTIDGKRHVGGFSMASDPGQLPIFELGVRLSDDPVSQWLHTTAAKGDTVLIKGGQGNCVYIPTEGDDVTFIVGGIGITPPLSMLRAALATTTTFTARLLYSVRTAEDTAYLTLLTEMAEDPRFSLYTTLTQDPANTEWTGHRGRLTLKNVLAEKTPNTIFYTFGPPDMVDRFCLELEQANIPNANIRTERWW